MPSTHQTHQLIQFCCVPFSRFSVLSLNFIILSHLVPASFGLNKTYWKCLPHTNKTESVSAPFRYYDRAKCKYETERYHARNADKKKEQNRILSGGKTTIHNLHLSSSVSAVRKNAGKKRTAPTASGWHKKLTTHLICAMLKCIKETSHK